MVTKGRFTGGQEDVARGINSQFDIEQAYIYLIDLLNSRLGLENISTKHTLPTLCSQTKKKIFNCNNKKNKVRVSHYCQTSPDIPNVRHSPNNVGTALSPGEDGPANNLKQPYL